MSRRLALATGLAAALVCAAGASAARDVRAGGTVTALAAAGAEVGFAAAAGPGCTELRVWSTADRGVRRYARHCFEATSTGSGVAGLAVAGGRALWSTYTGGNVREWSLWTRSRTSPPRRIGFATADADGPPPLLVGTAWEGSLPYAHGRTIVALAADGSRRFATDAPERVAGLAAHSRGVAAVLSGGDVLTLTTAGAIVRRHAFAPGVVRAALLAGPGLLVHTGRQLEVRGAASTRTYPLPAGSRLLGFSEGVVAYGTARELRLLRLADGRDSRFRTLPAGFVGALARRGLAVGAGTAVTWVAWPTVAAASRR